jgi:hypothetical protein
MLYVRSRPRCLPAAAFPAARKACQHDSGSCGGRPIMQLPHCFAKKRERPQVDPLGRIDLVQSSMDRSPHGQPLIRGPHKDYKRQHCNACEGGCLTLCGEWPNMGPDNASCLGLSICVEEIARYSNYRSCLPRFGIDAPSWRDCGGLASSLKRWWKRSGLRSSTSDQRLPHICARHIRGRQLRV